MGRHRPLRVSEFGEAGQQHHPGFHALLPDPVDQPEAILLRHLDIRHQEIDLFSLQNFPGFLRAVGAVDLCDPQGLPVQLHPDSGHHIGIVVHDQQLHLLRAPPFRHIQSDSSVTFLGIKLSARSGSPDPP